MQPEADDIQGLRLDDIQHLRVDDIQPRGLMICNLCEVGDIHGCAVMHTVFNGILRYSACTTDE